MSTPPERPALTPSPNTDTTGQPHRTTHGADGTGAHRHLGHPTGPTAATTDPGTTRDRPTGSPSVSAQQPHSEDAGATRPTGSTGRHAGESRRSAARKPTGRTTAPAPNPAHTEPADDGRPTSAEARQAGADSPVGPAAADQGPPGQKEAEQRAEAASAAEEVPVTPGGRERTTRAVTSKTRQAGTDSPGGPGPRGRKGAERRAALLDAAEEVLVTPGGAELTMRAVAAAAGVRLGHLQYYFPTHADLVAAVLERVLQRSAERLAPLLAPGDTSGGMTGAVTGRASGDTPEGSPVAAVAAPLAPNDASGGNAAEVVTALLAEQEDARLMRLFAEVWALAARDPAVAGAVRRFYDDYRDQLTAFLARTRPELPEAVRRARAGVFVMLIEGASLFRSGVAGEREPGTDAELVRAALALLGP